MEQRDMEQSLMEYGAPEVHEGWRVDSMSSADWALRKIRARRAEMAELKKYADAEKSRIDMWLKEQTETLQRDVDFFEAQLKPFVADALDGKKTKTLKFPCGSCSFKKSAPKFTKNEAELLAFVEENYGNFVDVAVKKSVKWNEFKQTLDFASDGRLVTENGEIVPGITYTVDEDTFTVKTEV